MMNEITFPNTVSATVAIVGVSAALVSGSCTWPTLVREQTFFVNEEVSTTNLSNTSSAEVTEEEFALKIASVFSSLLRDQEPLGAEFEEVWDANIDTLYEA